MLAAQIVVGLAVVITILLQSGRGAGFSGFTGAGAGGAEFFFGQQKGLDEALGRLTGILAVVFVALTYILARLWT
ncbi:MAG: preprotein translocase subunit SecG [Sulfobacillus sp.]